VHFHKHGYDRLCWLCLGSRSLTPWEYVTLEAWPRSLWPPNVGCKTAFQRVFELPNRVNIIPYRAHTTRVNTSLVFVIWIVRDGLPGEMEK
jgi:hypothetical protein